MVKIIKSNLLNVKGLANEDEKLMFKLISFEDIKIYLYLNLLHSNFFPDPEHTLKLRTSQENVKSTLPRRVQNVIIQK